MPHRVALFLTPLADEFLPRVGVAITKILERHGCVVSFPMWQTGSGQSFYAAGYEAEAAAAGRRFVALFESFDFVVTPSTLAAVTVRDVYPALLKDDAAFAARAESTSGKTFEFVDFLARVLQVNLKDLALPTPRSIAYQPTCYQRALGSRDETPGLLKRLGNVTLAPLGKADQCCGFGGTFSIEFPRISAALAEDKVVAIKAAAATAMICNEPGCALTLAGACHRAGVTVDVKHVAEFIADALGIDCAGF